MEPFDQRGEFEQAFSLAFEGAEIVPEPGVWNRIDTALAKMQNSSFRKRLLFFQMVAAASLVFAASITLYQVFKSDNNKPELATKQQTVLPAIDPDDSSKDLSKNPSLAETSKINEQSGSQPVKPEQTTPLLIEDEQDPVQRSTDFDSNEFGQQYVERLTPENQPGQSNSSLDLGIEPSEYIIQNELLPYEPILVPVWVKREEENKTGLWASAGFSAGSYNPSAGGFNLGFAAADEAALDVSHTGQDGSGIFSSEQGGRSIGGGIGFGKRISNRWLLESGLNYLHSEIDGTTNSFVENNGRNYPVFHETAFAGALQNASQFGVTSSFDFVSVPFKAGYVLVDKKIGWVATGGFGSNILLGNSLAADLGQLEKISYSISDSPYRRLSWSGIIGTEVYFNISDDYQLMIVPQYNFGITEITKVESSFSIVPNSFNMGIRLRYLMK